MLIVGEYRDDVGRKVARLEAGDALVSHGAYTFWLTTKHGRQFVTDKVGYPMASGTLFLGGDESGGYFCLEPGWVAGAIKAIKDGEKGRVPIEPVNGEDEAQNYIDENIDADPYFEDLRDLSNWTIYPESEWRSI